MKKVKVALIGYGHLGKWHAQKASQIKNCEFVAIVESFAQSQKKAKEDFPNVIVTSNINEVLDLIDAVLIVTPSSTHFELVKLALSAQKHVFCEKPLCETVEQANIIAKGLNKDLVLQVGHSERCHQAWELKRDYIQNNNKNFNLRIDRYAPFKGRAVDVDVVSDLMIHDIDLMLFLIGKMPKTVRAHGNKIRTNRWDHVCATFIFEDNSQAIITAGRNHIHEVRSFDFITNEGCLYVDLFKNKIYFSGKNESEGSEIVQEAIYERRDHLLIEQEKFYESIISHSEVFVDFFAGKQAVYFVNKVLEALEANKELIIDEI